MHAEHAVKRWTLELTPAASADAGRPSDGCNFPTGRAAVLLSAGQLESFEWLRLRYRPTVQGLMLQAIVNSVPVVVELGVRVQACRKCVTLSMRFPCLSGHINADSVLRGV